MPIRELIKHLVQSGQWILYCGIFGGARKEKKKNGRFGAGSLFSFDRGSPCTR